MNGRREMVHTTRNARICVRAGVAAALLAVLLAGAPVLGQGQGDDDSELAVHVFTMEHQNARDAIEFVLPLLSSRGTVELRPGGNTLVIRDTLATLSGIVQTLRRFDHPTRQVEVGIWLVRAESVGVSPVVPSDVPEEVLAVLEEQLSYETYRTVASSSVRGSEGEKVVFELEGYVVSFRLGTVVEERRVRLESFQISRASEGPSAPRVMMRSTLNPWLDRPSALVLSAGGQSSRALIVVLRCASPSDSTSESATGERR